MAPSPPDIFNEKARRAKHLRAASRLGEHDFVHQRIAEDVVERLESILRRFDRALFHGPAAKHIRAVLTPQADVGEAITADDIPGADIECRGDRLPFPDNSLDVVVSTLTMHAMNDPFAVLGEAFRALKPDGLFIVMFPGERSLHELRDVLQKAETSVLGRVAPRIAPMMAVKDGGALMQAAGFALPVADVARLNIAYSDPWRFFRDLRFTGETSCLRAGPKGGLRRDVLSRAVDIYKDEYSLDDGSLAVTIELVSLTGWKPHQSQPRPLKPGSATASLAEAVRKNQTP